MPLPQAVGGLRRLVARVPLPIPAAKVVDGVVQGGAARVSSPPPLNCSTKFKMNLQRSSSKAVLGFLTGTHLPTPMSSCFAFICGGLPRAD